MPPISPTDVARFEKKIEHLPWCGCWLWTAAVDDHHRVHYGMFGIGRKVYKAHRLAWWIYRGEIPTGLHIDHKCNVSLCVNPEHLEPVTQEENNRRQFIRTGHGNSKKTHCPRDHEYSASNTYINNKGARVCNMCMRLHRATWRKNNPKSRRA
jgi:hypothetical protein